MSIALSRAHELMTAALDYRAARQDMISSNIANADTPFYHPRDIDFEKTLAQKSQEIFNTPKNRLQMAQTNDKHLQIHPQHNSDTATLFYRDGQMARNDGNSVDIDVETTEMAKNSTMYKALTAALKKEAMIFKSVIDASAKTN